MKSVVLLLAIVALVAADGWWTDCSQNPVFSYSQLDIEPSPPKIGQNITVHTVGTFSVPVNAPIATLKVQYQVGNTWISLPTMTLKWCDYNPCPIAQGAFEGGFYYTVPRITPSGNYKGTIVATTENNAQIACVSFAFKFTTDA